MEDPPCTEKCRSIQHGNLVSAIARKGTDQQIVTLWSKTCNNYGHVKDCFGRSALHMVCSTSNAKAVEWLLQNEGSNIQEKEALSGYTPLHRSIYYGQINVARLLIQNGANMYITDNEGLTPLDLYLLDRNINLPHATEFRIQGDPTEVYIWGTNVNYNLGTGNANLRTVPEPLEVFGRSRISQIALQPYHSAFLSQNGEVFTCGVGNGGRLGLGNESTVLKPTKVKLPSYYRCTYVAAGRYHTMFLMENGEVRSCGSNENFVLGHCPHEAKILAPKTIDSLKVIKIHGVRTSNNHSAFYVSSRLYTCGKNYGQLGHKLSPGTALGSPILAPKWISNMTDMHERIRGGFTLEHLWSFTHVECNDYATVVGSEMGYIYLFYNFEYTKINIKHLDVVQIRVIGGRPPFTCSSGGATCHDMKGYHSSNNHNSPSSTTDSDNYNTCPLTLVLLTGTGRIIIWREVQKLVLVDLENDYSENPNPADGVFTKLYYNIGRSISITHVSINRSSILVTTTDGEAFQGAWNCTSTPNIFKNINDSSIAKRPRTDTDWGICTYKKKSGEKERDFVSMPLECIKLKRIPNIYSAVNVTCDPKGKTFAVIQRHHRLDYITVPNITPSVMNENLKQLYEEMSLEDDLHDVVFEVEDKNGVKKLFPAHKFIVASGCEVLYSFVKNAVSSSSDNESLSSSSGAAVAAVVRLENTDAVEFEQILQFIYTNNCTLLTPGHKIDNCSDTEEGNNLIRSTSKYARKVGLVVQVEKLNRMCSISGIISLKPLTNTLPRRYILTKDKVFDANSLKNLADLTLVTSDSKEIKVHRCILYARMEHFHTLWNGNAWSDSKSDRLQIPISYYGAKFLIDYLYADKIPDTEKYALDSVKHLVDEKWSPLDKAIEALSTSDYFFLDGFRTCTEITLYEMISLKSVSKILTVALMFNADQLKNACYHFIALNVASLLENRLLSDLSPEVMADVTKYYQSHHPCIKHRLLRPDPLLTPPDDMYDETKEFILPEFEMFVNSFAEYELTCKGKSGVAGTSKTSGHSHRGRHRSKTNSESEDSVIRVSPPPQVEKLRSTLNEQPFILVSKSNNESANNATKSAKTTGMNAVKIENQRQIRSTPIQIPLIKSGPNSTARPASILTKLNSQNQSSISFQRTRTISRELSTSFEEFPTLGNNNSMNSCQVPSAPTSHAQIRIPLKLNNTSQQVSANVEIETKPMPSPKDYTSHNQALKKKKTKWLTFEKEKSSQACQTSDISNPTTTTTAPLPIHPGRDPANPWRKLNAGEKTRRDDSENAGQLLNINFMEILKDEEEKVENWKKVTSKSLHLMQIEDEALNQLMKLYTTEDTDDGVEILKVERVGVTNIGAPPSWPHISSSPKSPAAGTSFGRSSSTHNVVSKK